MNTVLQYAAEVAHAAPLSAARREAAQRRPVRVCFIIDELTTAGTETQLLALIRRLDRRRVQPFLCLLRGKDPGSQELEPVDCPVLRLGVSSLRSPATVARVWRLLRFLWKHSIDIVQVYFPESTYLGVPAAWLAGVPRIVRTRNNLGYWMTPWHRRLGRLCNRLTDLLVANCEAARAAVLADEGLCADQVVVLENGVDLDRFATVPPMTERQTGFRVGVVANLRPVKGLETFVGAASILAAEFPDLRFHIAGEGPLRPELERRAAERGLSGRFVLEGSLTDVPGFLDGLAVAVLPSRSEGMSNALLEYMAAARPIVATAVGGNTRLIEDGVHGLLVPPDDPAAFASAINRLLSDHDLATRLGRSARRRAIERYSREAMVKRFEEFYLRLMEDPAGLTRAGSDDD